MHDKQAHSNHARIVDNLRRAVLRQRYSDQEAMKQVMREIRLSKERAWRQSPS